MQTCADRHCADAHLTREVWTITRARVPAAARRMKGPDHQEMSIFDAETHAVELAVCSAAVALAKRFEMWLTWGFSQLSRKGGLIQQLSRDSLCPPKCTQPPPEDLTVVA
jgi:anti-sigma-K factor RskA